MTSEVEGFIVLFIFNLTGQEVTAEQDLFELGVVDSLAFNELLVAVEQEFSVELDLDSIDDWASLGSARGLANALAKL